MEFKRLIKKTDYKFLNMYIAKYKGEKDLDYFFVTRRKEGDVQKTNICDAVKILPYIPETNEIVFIKNFRYAINDFVYELPAGLVEPNENLLEAAKRELKEETGAEVLSIKKVVNSGFTSVGLTDETLELYVADVKLTSNQNLDEDEIIDIIKVKVESIENFLNAYTIDVISALLVKYFVLTLK